MKIKPEINYILKYINISGVGYAYVFLFLFILVEYAKMNETISFILVYGSWYVLQYFFQLRYLFNKKHNKNFAYRYIIYIVFFFTLTTLVYSIGIGQQVHYIISYIITIFIIMPIRFLILKNFVFK